MSDADAPMFPRERRPRRKAFPVFPVLCGVLLLLIAGALLPKLLLDQNERQAYAQAQQIGQAYFSSLKSDSVGLDREMNDIGLQPPTAGMDFAWNRKQVDRLRAVVARYRALGAQHRKTARDAMAALKIRSGLRKRYLAEADRTLADKAALLEKRLSLQEAMLNAAQTQYDILARHPGTWRQTGFGVLVGNNADFQALEQQTERLRQLSRDEAAVTASLLAPELWVSPPP